MNELNKKATEILNSIDEKFFTDMTEPIRLGNSETVLIKDKSVLAFNNEVWQFYAQDIEHAQLIADYISANKKETCTICLHGEFGKEECSKAINAKWFQDCYEAVYFSKELYTINPNFDIRKLTREHAVFVSDNYSLNLNNPDRLLIAQDAIERGMLGIFEDGKLAGFIGTHEEGSIGMLEILPQYRKRGYGEALEKAITNYFIQTGRITFAHIIDTNNASLHLQKKIGMWLSTDKVYWMGC